MYHTITAAKPLTFKKTRSGMQTIRKMKLILLSFHERFLNFNENMGCLLYTSDAADEL